MSINNQTNPAAQATPAILFRGLVIICLAITCLVLAVGCAGMAGKTGDIMPATDSDGPDRVMAGEANLQSAAPVRQQTDADKTAQRLGELRKRTDIYWGEGMADITGDLGAARMLAKKRALSDLSQKISVQVASDIQIITGAYTTLDAGRTTEAVEKSITRKIETYSSHVLENVHEDQLFLDYPKPGWGTYFVWISIKEYTDKIAQDMTRKKSLVVDQVKNGDAAYAAGDFMAALSQYATSQTMQQDFFGHIPVYLDPDGTGARVSVAGYVSDRMRRFSGALTLRLLNKDFLYDAAGALEKTPRVHATITDAAGNPRPVKNLPLKVVFIKGSGQAGQITTGVYGQADLPVSGIDPAFKQTVVRVMPDPAIFPKGTDVQLPAIQVDLQRKRTVALSVQFTNMGKPAGARDLTRGITARLLENRMAVVTAGFKTAADVAAGRDLNADYALIVLINAHGGANVGGYANMHVAECAADITLYRMPSGSLAHAKQTPASRGFGTSGDTAGWDAFGNNKDAIMAEIAKMTDYLK